MGLAWLVAAILPDRIFRGPRASLWVLVLVPGWLANVGTTRQWSEAGSFCDRAYRAVVSQQEDWESRSYVLYDTRGLVEGSPHLPPMTAVATSR